MKTIIRDQDGQAVLDEAKADANWFVRWDEAVARLGMMDPKLHRAIVTALTDDTYSWMTGSARVRLLSAGLRVLGEAETSHHIAGLNGAFHRAFPKPQHGQDRENFDRILLDNTVVDAAAAMMALGRDGASTEMDVRSASQIAKELDI